MLGILFSLLPLFGWGSSDYVSSILSKKAQPATVNLAFFAITTVPVMLFCSLYGWPEVSVKILFSFFVVELILTAGFMTMIKAFSTGATGIVAPISNAYAIITLILAVIFLGVSVNLLQVLSIFTVMAGIGLLTYKKQLISNTARRKGELYALLAMVLFGFGFAGFDIVSTQEWYQNTILFQLVGLTVAILVYFVTIKKDNINEVVKVSKMPITILGGLSASVGTLGLFIAIQNTNNIAIPASIAAASPLITIALSRRFDKEHLSLHQYIGAVVVVLGIVLLSLSI